MPKLKDIKKVLVIGSGPIIIGQAAEFDYAGTQACRALKEEGLEVVLVNSNPATIMTDANIADRVYIRGRAVVRSKLEDIEYDVDFDEINNKDVESEDVKLPFDTFTRLANINL